MTSNPYLFSLPISKARPSDSDSTHPLFISLEIERKLKNYFSNYPQHSHMIKQCIELFSKVTDGNKIFIDELRNYRSNLLDLLAKESDIQFGKILSIDYPQSLPKFFHDMSGDLFESYFFALTDIFNRFNESPFPTKLNGFELSVKEIQDFKFFCIDANQIKKMDLDELEQEMFHYIREKYKGVQGPYFYHEIADAVGFLRQTKQLEEDVIWAH